MCRFAVYLGSPIRLSSLITEPTHSIIQQSFRSREREEPLNGDGFGLAWYVPSFTAEPAVFKEVNPAWSSVNLSSLAQATWSPCIMAHVRAASPGLPVTQLNCHPFARGAYAFMHNGEVGGFRQVIRRLREALMDESYHAISGSTDSEHVFAVILERLAARDDAGTPAGMAAAMTEAIRYIESLRAEAGVTDPAFLNLVLCDGHRAVVTRYVTPGHGHGASLHLHMGREYVCEDGVCRMVPTEAPHEAVLIASEPLSTDSGWKPVPPNHVVTVDEALGVRMEAIG